MSPLPVPNTGESEDNFMSRCMGNDVMNSEFPEQKQRVAVCMSQFRRKRKTRTLKLGGSFELRKLSDTDHVIAGYASPAIIDSEGDLIPIETLRAWWDKFIQSEYPIITLSHDDVPIGKVLLEYTDSFGTIHKSGVDSRGLYVVSELRKDTKTANELWQQIQQWGGRGAYSISANTFTDPKVCFTDQGELYHRYEPASGELNSITVGREGANDQAIFQIVKLKKHQKRILRVR